MKYFITVSLFFAFMFSGCDTGTGNGSSDLPVSTKRWELGSDGYIQYYTNDSNNYDYSFWVLYENNNAPNTYEIECKKVGGNLSYYYGMVFGASGSGTTQYYCLDITANGYYRIRKEDNGSRTIIKSEASSDKLFTGLNQINDLKITLEETTYTIFLNNNQVFQINDLTPYGTRIGFYVAVGTDSDESFPNSPVDVRFRQK
jgi:hypothetical protein